MTLRTLPAVLAPILSGCPLSAQVTLTDLGTTAPAVFDTGYTGATNDRFSLDTNDSCGQSFTPATTGDLEFLYLAYNAGGAGSFTIYVDPNYTGGGQAEILADGTSHVINIADFISDPNGLSGAQATDNNNSPLHWMRLDFSNENIQLAAGQQAAYFIVGGTESTTDDSGWLFAPRWNNSTTNNAYSGGGTIAGANFSGNATSDFGFAVSITGGEPPPPPPSAIQDRFDSGNLSGGTGWLTNWTAGSVINTTPVASGGNYLSLPSLTGSTGSVRQWSSAIVSSSGPAYTTRFDLRIDTLPGFGSNGRLGITESSTNATNTSSNMSWMIFGSTNFSLGDGGQPTWGFHNGIGTGAFINPLVNSGMPIIAGRVYRFEVIVSPADLAYAVNIDDLNDAAPAYQSPRLGFRRTTPISNPFLSFSTQDVSGTCAMSIDAVTVDPGGTLPENTLPPASAADRVAGNMILLNDNGGWCWYQDERSLYDAQAGTILFNSTANYLGYGGEPRDGDIDTVSFDPATGARKRFIQAKLPFRGGNGDDHNMGAVWKRADGRYLVAYCDHLDTSRNTRFRISTNPHDNTAWNPEFTFNWGPSGDVTYSNLLFLSAEGSDQGRLYNFTRGQSRDPHFSYSDDQGNTWTYGGRLSSQPTSLGYSNGYYKFITNGVDRIDFICTEAHPRDYDNSIYHGYIQGGKSYNSHGVEIDANIYDTTGPAPQAFTQVWQTQGVSATTLHHGWTTELEYDAAQRPVILFTNRYGNTVVDGHAGAGDHRIFYGRFNGTTWSTTQLGRVGQLFHTGEQDYTGLGCIHPNDPDTIYISTYIHPATNVEFASKKREIFQGKTTDNGTTWNWTQLTFNSTVDNARPIIPSWDADHTALLWWRGYYPWQRDYDLSVVGMMLDADHKVGTVTYHDAVTANTTLADGSPLATTGPETGTGPAADGQWHLSADRGGNGGAALCANFASSELAPTENAPALKTTLTGLAAGTYDVFAYFLSPPTADDWRLSAGFASNDLLNFRRYSSQQAEASQFIGAVETLWSAQGTALYRGYIGRKTVGTGGSIEVIIDDTATSVAYDGIGLAPVLPNLRIAAGSTSTLSVDSTLYGDVINHGSLILKGGTPLSYQGTFSNNGFLDLLTYTGPVSPEWLTQGSVLMPGEGLRIDSISLSETTVTTVIGAHQGHIYQLQRSHDLSPGSWTNTGTPAEGQGVGGTPAPLQLTAPKPTGDRHFFRVAVD
jgi:hypothetical protein